MIAELERIIREEEAKPESERDADLIDDCIREIAELKGVKAEFSAEEVAEITDNLIKAAEKEQKRKHFVRLAAGIAAAVVLVTGITACTINPALINWFVRIVRMPFGTTVAQDKITYVYQGTQVKYDSVDQLFKSINLKLYYPTVLPKEVKLERIDSLNEGDFYAVFFEYDSDDLHYTVQLNHNNGISNENEIVTTIETNGLKWDVCTIGEYYVSISCVNGNTYIIQTKTLDDMILVISGLKEESQ